MKYVKYLLGLIGILGGWLFLERGKRKTAEAINENVEVKEKVQKLEGERLENSATIKAEEERRKEINDKATEEKSKPVGDTDIVDFFNRLK